MKLSIQSYDDFICDYDRSLDWLCGFSGEDRVRKCRFGTYLGVIETAINAFKDGSELSEDCRIRFAHAHEEAESLIEICTHLRSGDSATLKSHVDKLIKGRQIRHAEKNDISRSTQFELLIAARLARNGAIVNLNESSDIVAEYQNRTFLVEGSATIFSHFLRGDGSSLILRQRIASLLRVVSVLPCSGSDASPTRCPRCV